MSALKAVQVMVTLKDGKATVINGVDMDMSVTDDGRLAVYDFHHDRSYMGPVFFAIRGEWLTASMTFEPSPTA